MSARNRPAQKAARRALRRDRKSVEHFRRLYEALSFVEALSAAANVPLRDTEARGGPR